MLPRSFYFIRHGETDWNRARRLQGFTDIPLNDTGRAQAQSAAALLEGISIDLVVTSPLTRALETAEIINKRLGRTLLAEEGIRERGYGTLEGATIDEMERLRAEMIRDGLPSEENGYPCPPQAEPYADFSQRVLSALQRHLQPESEARNVLFVSHGGVYRALKRSLAGEADRSPNARPFLFERDAAGGWRVLSLASAYDGI